MKCNSWFNSKKIKELEKTHYEMYQKIKFFSCKYFDNVNSKNIDDFGIRSRSIFKETCNCGKEYIDTIEYTLCSNDTYLFKVKEISKEKFEHIELIALRKRCTL